MRKISNKTRSGTGGGSSGEGSTARIPGEGFEHIKLANKKIRLLDVLRHYGIKIEKNYQRPIWSNNIRCPLPSHKGAKERTPSFGYRFDSDFFHCLGCNASGRAVEFVSLYEGITRTEVAERILSKYGEEISEDDFAEYNDNLSPLLVDAAGYIQNFIKENKHNKEKMDELNKFIWWIDFYLMSKAFGNKIDSDGFSYRINRMKELLSYGNVSSR